MFQMAAIAMALASRLGAKPEPKPEPRTHDYTMCRWGHAYNIMEVIDGGQRLKVCGHGHGISEGDFLIMSKGTGETRYRVDAISYFTDPGDMWSADLAFAPRQKAS